MDKIFFIFLFIEQGNTEINLHSWSFDSPSYEIGLTQTSSHKNPVLIDLISHNNDTISSPFIYVLLWFRVLIKYEGGTIIDNLSGLKSVNLVFSYYAL